MIRPSLALVVLGALALPSAPTLDAAPPRSERSAADVLAGMTWLEGHWRGTAGANVFETCYTSPEGGEIVSASKEIANGRCVFFELERFLVQGDEVVLIPHPGGRASVAFPLSDLGEKRATFSNEEHDFPKHLTYERKADDRLVITLTGDEGGEARMEVYDLRAKR
jgi:hypothetical protein